MLIKYLRQLFCSEHAWKKRHKCDMLCEHWGGRHEYWDCMKCGKEIYASSNGLQNIVYQPPQTQ